MAGNKTPKCWTRRSVLLALAGLGLATPACEFNKWFSWNGGKPVVFGYGTAPNYDKRFKTIRIKIFKDPTFWAVTPVPGLEDELTLALVRAIELKTPYKIVSGDADLEISGAILSFLQSSLNYTQLNEIRDVQTTLTAQVVLKDLRTGEILSKPARRATEPAPPAGLLPGQLDPLNSRTTMPGSVMSQELSAAPIAPGSQSATLSGSGSSPTPNTGNPALGSSNIPGSAGAPPGASGAMPGLLAFQGVVVTSTAEYVPEIGTSISTAQQDNVNRLATQIVSMMETPW